MPANTSIASAPSPGLWIPSLSLLRREVVRFCRQRNRVIGALATPILFWFVIGSGVGSSFTPPAGSNESHYLQYFFPGTVALIVLFTAIFSTISIIEDRREGFLQAVLASPAPASSIVLGKLLGGAILSLAQGLLFLLLAPAAGIPLSAPGIARFVPACFLLGFSLTGIGFLFAWPMDSTQGYHAVMNILLMPMWLLSGALFPVPPGASWVGWVAAINPATYGVAALRASLVPPASGLPPYRPSLLISALFAAAAFAASCALVNRRRSA